MSTSRLIDLFWTFKTVEECVAASRTYILLHPDVALENLKWFKAGGRFSNGGENSLLWDEAIKRLEADKRWIDDHPEYCK